MVNKGGKPLEFILLGEIPGRRTGGVYQRELDPAGQTGTNC